MESRNVGGCVNYGFIFDHAHRRESHPKAADFDGDGQAINICGVGAAVIAVCRRYYLTRWRWTTMRFLSW